MPLRGDSSLDCKEARELTRGFLSGGGSLERRAEWRAHLAACADCDEQYRDTVEMLSRLHRARKDGGPAESPRSAAAEPEPALERRSLITFSPPPARIRWMPRKRGGWLALAIPFVALLVFGAIGLPGTDVRNSSAQALHGVVEVDEHMLAPGDAARPVHRGSQIVAAASARARLVDAQSELELEGEGALACEGFQPLRVRLFGGKLVARGACEVSSTLGVLKSPAGELQASLELDGLHVRAGSSGASFLDQTGQHAIAPGAEFVCAAPR